MSKPDNLLDAIEKGFSDGAGDAMKDHRHYPVRHADSPPEYTERHVPTLLDMVARKEITVDDLLKLKLTREAMDKILRLLGP